ncbi:ASCH domain-containing protein [Nonomuraea sp. PA05]|uniref:ASCH domain-containing protein n=1 Tax=Nonomuraea sp. PA05 TaxID=2604466 RepID=UPI0016523A28|nr:ASCH domain-containing protein [Nonomuraea sp. PA05]
MKALTVYQPWAWAIAFGDKDVENRTRGTRHRGELAIHAGKPWDEYGAADPRIIAAAGQLAGPLLRDDRFEFGSIVAVAELVDVVRDSPSPWAAPGQCHWLLANVRPVAEPVPCRGWQNVWDVPPEVEVAVQAQLDRRDLT